MEEKCKDRVKENGVTSLIVAAGERCSSLGVGFENMMHSWVINEGSGPAGPAGTGRGASRWLGGGKTKAQGRGMG